MYISDSTYGGPGDLTQKASLTQEDLQFYLSLKSRRPTYLSRLAVSILGKSLLLSMLFFISYLLTLSWFLKLLMLLLPIGIE